MNSVFTQKINTLSLLDKINKERNFDNFVYKQSNDNLNTLNNNEQKMKNNQNNQKNKIEISYVNEGKMEEKTKDIETINNLINICDKDITYIESIIEKYQTDSFIMDSKIEDEKIGEDGMVVVNRVNIDYYVMLKNEFFELKRKLEYLLNFYKSEKDLTFKKKNDIEKLEKLKNKLLELKYKFNAKQKENII